MPHRLLTLFLSCAGIVGCAASAPQRAPTQLELLNSRLVQNPRDVQLNMELSEYHLQAQDYLRAQQYFNAAEQHLNRQRPDAAGRIASADLRGDLMMLGIRIAVRSQQYYEAVRRCQLLLDRREDVNIRHMMALMYEAIGDEFAAARQHRLLVALHSDVPAQHLAAAHFYERSRLPDRERLAAEHYSRYLSVRPDGPDADAARVALAAARLDRADAKE